VTVRAPLTGAVLVGGRSQRMGSDKALMVIDGGVPLVAALVGALQTCCEEVLLVGGDPARFVGRDLSARFVADAAPGAGPLAGILGALDHARHPGCLVVACDMPFVTSELLQAMAAEPTDYSALAYPGPDGLEPLLAIYTRTCTELLRAALAVGELRARDFLARLGARALPDAVLDRVDPERRASTNVNTPEELAAAHRILQGAPDRASRRIR